MSEKQSLVLTATKVAEMQHLTISQKAAIRLRFNGVAKIWTVAVYTHTGRNRTNFKGDFMEVLDQVINFLGDLEMYSD